MTHASIGPLFDRPAPARRSDPSSSHEAGQAVAASGARRAQAEAVLELVRRWPGRTSAELAANAAAVDIDIGRHAIARRLPELREAGLVRRGPKRACKAAGRTGVTWEPVVEQEFTDA